MRIKGFQDIDLGKNRKFRISLVDLNIEKAAEIMGGATETVLVATINESAQRMARRVSKFADEDVEFSARARQAFERRLERTWQRAFRNYARFHRVASYIGELVVSHLDEGAPLE